MKTKIILVIIVLIAVAGAGWYGLFVIRSQGPVLLISQEQGGYTYSNIVNQKDLDESFEVIGYVDDFSAEEIREMTEGFALYEILEEDPVFDIKVVIPDANQAPAWDEALNSLTKEQRQLCGDLPRADLSQACQFRHLMFNAVTGGADASVCDKIFVESYQSDCRYIVSNQILGTFSDVDGDLLMDSYEVYVNPDEFIVEEQ